MGESEKMLAGFLNGLPRESYRVSDKLTPQCMDASSKTAVADMYEAQLRTMGIDHFDVYWVHNTVGAPRWIGELAAYFEGRDDAPVIGVSNHNLAEVKQADAILREHGLRLGAVQNHFSLINRSSEDSGILDWCRQNDVEFWSYMVLEQGALSGKYDTTRPMPEGSARAQKYNPVLDRLETLNAELAKVAEAHDVEPAQIPVAWAIAKGTRPIVGVTRERHVADAAKAGSIVLSTHEVQELERVADSLGINAVRAWEKKMD
jgi:aryl-alcohol dehydrogenase-like predicted oxidoreductase